MDTTHDSSPEALPNSSPLRAEERLRQFADLLVTVANRLLQEESPPHPLTANSERASVSAGPEVEPDKPTNPHNP